MLKRYHFDEYLILEYKIKNSQENIVLKKVNINVNFSSEDLKVAHNFEVDEI